MESLEGTDLGSSERNQGGAEKKTSARTGRRIIRGSVPRRGRGCPSIRLGEKIFNDYLHGRGTGALRQEKKEAVIVQRREVSHGRMGSGHQQGIDGEGGREQSNSKRSCSTAPNGAEARRRAGSRFKGGEGMEVAMERRKGKSLRQKKRRE